MRLERLAAWRMLERMPERILLVGIEGRCFDRLGEAMTSEVAAAVIPAVETVHKELNSALQGDNQ